MLKELIENIKNVEEGELIRPIDYFETMLYKDKELTKRIGIKKFDKNDIFEIQVVTPNEIIAYVKNKGYVLLQKFDLNDFEDVE